VLPFGVRPTCGWECRPRVQDCSMHLAILTRFVGVGRHDWPDVSVCTS
jgi:hypothetical protein